MHKLGIGLLVCMALSAHSQSDTSSTKGLYRIEKMPYSPFDDYYNTYNKAIACFNSKNWNDAFILFQRAHAIYDSLNASESNQEKLDTNTIFFAGVSAQNNGREEDAAEWFSLLAKRRVGGAERSLIYKALLAYYLDKLDAERFYKYLQTAKELYPNEVFFETAEFDFIRKGNDINRTVAFYNKKLQVDPSNARLHYDKALLLFRVIHSNNFLLSASDEGLYRNIIVEELEKATMLSPSFIEARILLADHYKLTAVGVAEQLKKNKSSDTIKVDATKYRSLLDTYRSCLILASNYYRSALLVNCETHVNEKEKIRCRTTIAALVEALEAEKHLYSAGSKQRMQVEQETRHWLGIYQTIH